MRLKGLGVAIGAVGLKSGGLVFGRGAMKADGVVMIIVVDWGVVLD